MIRRKSEFVKTNGFGGGMIWALDLDDFANRLVCMNDSQLLNNPNVEFKGRKI
jgi:GH18 family chitinase